MTHCHFFNRLGVLVAKKRYGADIQRKQRAYFSKHSKHIYTKSYTLEQHKPHKVIKRLQHKPFPRAWSRCTETALCSCVYSHKGALYWAPRDLRLKTDRWGHGMLAFMHAWTFNTTVKTCGPVELYGTLDLMDVPAGRTIFERVGLFLK